MQYDAILGPEGLIAQKLTGYEVRPQQIEMAGAVAEAFESRQHLMVEAGTGVGKSFAYLVPAIQLAVRENARVVISTNTIALQEQLMDKDIPFLQKLMPEPFSAVLVKGRSNYVGLRRLARASARRKLLFDSDGDLTELWDVEQWAYQTTDGSLSDLPLQPSPAVWDRVNSDADDCLGRQCPHYRKCFYQRARNEAAGAQLLIVNHAMLFSDLALRGQGASVLPDYQYVVLDEAHTVESVAGDHLGVSVAAAQIRHLLSTLHNERTGRGVLHTQNGRSVIPFVAEANRSLDQYCQSLAHLAGTTGDRSGRLRNPPDVEQPITPSLSDLHERLGGLRADTSDEQDRSELGGLMDRCRTFASAVDRWHTQKSEEWVYWVETDERAWRVTMRSRPLDVGPVLRETLFDAVRSVVMTSATLTVASADPFGYVRSRLGLSDVKCLDLGSPFDYARQLTVHIASGMPNPTDTAAFIPACCDAIRKYVQLTDGHAFVLFTSYDLLRRCAERLSSHFAEAKMPLLVHGTGTPRSTMLRSFRDTPRSVLFGTDSFWAGVDVPGDALRNVIITKIPFAVPSQPMVQARIEKIRAEGGNPFAEFQLPEAVLKFRQGVGRLIRTRQDRGIVVILDSRVRTRSYGRRFLDALPPCEVIIDAEI